MWLAMCGAALMAIGLRRFRPTQQHPSPPKPREASAPGVPLAYDVAVQKLAHQVLKIDRLNTQLAVILGALIAVTGLVFQAAESSFGRVMAGLLLLASLMETARASRVTTFQDAPEPTVFASYAGDNPNYMKEVALPEVLAAMDYNRPRIDVKGNRLNRGIVFLGLAVIVIFLDRFVPDAIKLAGQAGGLVHHFIP